MLAVRGLLGNLLDEQVDSVVWRVVVDDITVDVNRFRFFAFTVAAVALRVTTALVHILIRACDFERLEYQLVLRQCASFVAKNEIYLRQILMQRKVFHLDTHQLLLLFVNDMHLEITLDKVDVYELC